MKKLAALIFIVFLLLLGAFQAPRVFAQTNTCIASANVGSTLAQGGSYRINMLIDASQLIDGRRYEINAWFQGRPIYPVTAFTGDKNTPQLQIAFDISKPKLWIGPTADVHFSINDPSDHSEACVTNQVTLQEGLPQNTNKNLPSLLSSPSIFCDAGKTQVKTALGCIPTDPSAFIGFILTIGIGLAGGIAFLLILFGGFQILTSAGNPEQLNAGKELVSSAIAGLLLIIFSVFILRIIGVDILGIPGFTK